MKSKKSGCYFLVSLLSTTVLVLSSQSAFSESKPTYESKMKLAQLLQFNGNTVQAIKAYKYAAALKPNAFDPHFALVNIYSQQQDFPAEAEECREALRIKSNNRDLHLVLSNLYRTMAGNASDPEEQKKLMADAIKELDAADKLGANPAQIHGTLAMLLAEGSEDKFARGLDFFNKQFYVPALQCFTETTASGDKEAQRLFYCALCYLHTAKFQEAEEFLQRICKNFPGSEAAGLSEKYLKASSSRQLASHTDRTNAEARSTAESDEISEPF